MIGHAALAWSNVGIPILGLVFLLAYFWGWGSVLLLQPQLRSAPGRTQPMLVLALGVGASVLTMLLLGAAGLLYRSVFLMIAIPVVVAGMHWLPPWRYLHRPRAVHAEPWTRWHTLLASAAALLFLVVGGLCLLPDESWDTVAYHLAIGKLYVREARIIALPWLFQSNFPIAGELVFLHGLLVDGDRLALPLNLVLYAVAAMAVFAIARLELARGPALLAMLVFMTSPAVAAWVNTCNVEIAWTAFATVSLWCALHWRRESTRPAHPNDAWLYRAAILAGCAAGTKVVGLLSAMAVGVIILGSSMARLRARARLLPVVKYGAVFALVAGPFYLKTYIQTGTPLWPESLGVFQVRDYSDEIWARNLAFGRSLWGGAPMTPLDLVRAAWNRIDDPTVALVTVFAAATLLQWQLFPSVAPLFLVVVVHYAFWCFASHQARFLIPALPPAIVGLMELTYGNARTAAGRALCAVFWLVTVSFSASIWVAKAERFRTAVLPVLAGSEARDHLLRGSPLYAAARLVGRYTTPDAKILLFQEVRGYHLERAYMWGDPLNQGVLYYHDLRRVDQLHQAMRRLGITHVLAGREHFPFTVARRYARSDWDLMLRLLSMAPRVFATSDHVLYAVNLSPLAPEARATPFASAAAEQDGFVDGSLGGDRFGNPFCGVASAESQTWNEATPDAAGDVSAPPLR